LVYQFKDVQHPADRGLLIMPASSAMRLESGVVVKHELAPGTMLRVTRVVQVATLDTAVIQPRAVVDVGPGERIELSLGGLSKWVFNALIAPTRNRKRLTPRTSKNRAPRAKQIDFWQG
jgi:hypothetical protein